MAVIDFTGAKAGSFWWRDTRAVLVEGAKHVALYGELTEAPELTVGAQITTGAVVGHVLRVLRQDRGLPTTMLHFELYVPGTREPVWWRLDEPRPSVLLDPTEPLATAEDRP